MKNTVISFLLGALLLLTISCSNNQQEDFANQTDQQGESLLAKIKGFVVPTSPTFQVLSAAGTPISGAAILIGSGVDSPFKGNLIQTDANGEFAIPAAWTSEQSVTIAAPGFIRATYFGQEPRARKFVIRPTRTQARIELKGTTTGYKIVDKDGIVDFGVVLPKISNSDFFTFNVNDFISTEVDTISVLGQSADIPSNVSLPKQRESYVLPFTLEKPIYRLYFDTLGEKTVYALRGQFPLKPVIKALKDKQPFSQLINYFSFQGGSIRNVKLTSPSNALDIPVTDLLFDQVGSVMAPSFAQTEMVLAVPLSSYQDKLIPTDVKNLTSTKAQSLNLAKGGSVKVLSVKTLANTTTAGGAISAELKAYKANMTAYLLPLPASPVAISKEELQIPTMTDSKVQALGTFATLSTVTKVQNGKDVTEHISQVWDVYAPQWSAGFRLPSLPDQNWQTGQYRWEVVLMGNDAEAPQNLELGPDLFNNVTHATHSQVDFQ